MTHAFRRSRQNAQVLRCAEKDKIGIAVRDKTLKSSSKLKLKVLEGKLNAAGKRFAIVVSRFNAFITDRLLQSAFDGLVQCGAETKNIRIVRVPGAFEIPSAARTLTENKKYDAIICIGCLLRGDTAHYDVIVNEF
jgi:6,7-dimethyl-8-ribityllumazine synthase